MDFTFRFSEIEIIKDKELDGLRIGWLHYFGFMAEKADILVRIFIRGLIAFFQEHGDLRLMGQGLL